jgi:hypothetical protein
MVVLSGVVRFMMIFCGVFEHYGYVQMKGKKITHLNE